MSIGRWLWLPLLLALTGCNWVGNVTGLTKDANKAIGAACRQTGRSLEECYLRNPEADKAAIYAGWREMNEYMAKNKLDTMEPPKEASTPAGMPAPTASSHGAASAPVEKSSANILPSGPRPLSNEEAERAARTDPQVEAVLAAIRNKPAGEGGEKSKAASGGEPEQKRLLNIINELNKNSPAPGSHG
ncbi:hypothetical protein [Chromobacterium haemolyticum]|uniref:Lipoprotein n=1 Tax=Chromobacterium haemolyticum TaxID=394935 RepID=A0A1W0CI96_9NEIS|nr:hypothetical protein [Chromobacterium haemolyticum]OQS34527.1 hypothetical protein B0T45_18875 [Chromobacterium haemolyticum]